MSISAPPRGRTSSHMLHICGFLRDASFPRRALISIPPMPPIGMWHIAHRGEPGRNEDGLLSWPSTITWRHFSVTLSLPKFSNGCPQGAFAFAPPVGG
jgi:hypothetical protein